MTDEDTGHDLEEAVPAADEEPAGAPAAAGRSAVRLALSIGVVAVLTLGGLCGWLGYRATGAQHAEQLRARLVQVAKQGAVNLTTIDYARAEADVQRILDSATGGFYDDFKARSAPFIEVVKKVRSKSVGTVTEAGLESITGQEGRVLVAVTVKTTSGGTTDEQSRYWRMRLTVVEQGEDVKIAKVDFVA